MHTRHTEDCNLLFQNLVDIRLQKIIARNLLATNFRSQSQVSEIRFLRRSPYKIDRQSSTFDYRFD